MRKNILIFGETSTMGSKLIGNFIKKKHNVISIARHLSFQHLSSNKIISNKEGIKEMIQQCLLIMEFSND